jgi:prephenate dehydratase
MKLHAAALACAAATVFCSAARSDELAFLGPKGTYSDQAAQTYASQHPPLAPVAMESLTAVLESVADGRAQAAMLPAYATISGYPAEAWRALTKSSDPGVRVVGEVVLPLSSELVVKKGTTRDQITSISSHPNALKEAGGYLSSNFPKVPLKETRSTAAAAQAVSEGDGTMAAVAGPAAAKLFGLDVLASGIQDDKNNATSFWALRSSRGWVVPTKASHLIVSLDVDPGAMSFSDLVVAARQDGFHVQLVYTASIPGPIYTNRFVAMFARDAASSYRATSALLAKTIPGSKAILLGAY